MRKKIAKLVGWLIASLCLAKAILWAHDGDIALLGELASAFIALTIERACRAVQDLMDTTDWRTSRRKLQRGDFINNDTRIRISFAYLYRIKLGNRYLLVKNKRGTHKFQPVGGVYKMRPQEKRKLKGLFSVVDDKEIKIDESSRNDYRLYVSNGHLPRFVRRFDRGAMRERIDNVGREFREELVDTGILAWDRIEYRYCGRHMTELQFEPHFQTYELLLADIVELCPSESQRRDLEELASDCPPQCRFATSEEVYRLGVDTEAEKLGDIIATHTFKMLEEEENALMKPREAEKTYRVRL